VFAEPSSKLFKLSNESDADADGLWHGPQEVAAEDAGAIDAGPAVLALREGDVS
jgi:hypothetical protein